MTRVAKQKAKRRSTAAYGASQPLFDALRIGFERVGEQKANLSIARDIVQHLHVKVPNADSSAETDRYERSIDCAVRAWRSATETYSEIFDVLAKVTAPEPSEGKEARQGHAQFTAMARMAADAKAAAHTFDLFEQAAKAKAAVANGNGNGVDVEMEDADSDDASSASSGSESDVEDDGAADNTPTNPILVQMPGNRQPPDEAHQKKSQQHPEKRQRLSEKTKYDPQSRKILPNCGAEKPSVPFGTPGNTEKKAWKTENSKQRREKKQQKRAANMIEQAKGKRATDANGTDHEKSKGSVEESSQPLHDNLNEGGVGQKNAGPHVEYEDVSAEVGARLKAKQEAKEAKKKNKKRKRESGASIETVDGESKPSKKKSKGLDGDADIVAAKEKRKKHDRPMDYGENDRSAKRKKSKR